MCRTDPFFVIDHFRQMRQDFRKLSAAFSFGRKLELGREQFRIGSDESISLILHDFSGDRFAVVFHERRFEIEEVKLTGRPSLEEINHPLGFGGEVRSFGRKRIRGQRLRRVRINIIVAQQRG